MTLERNLKEGAKPQPNPCAYFNNMYLAKHDKNSKKKETSLDERITQESPECKCSRKFITNEK